MIFPFCYSKPFHSISLNFLCQKLSRILLLFSPIAKHSLNDFQLSRFHISKRICVDVASIPSTDRERHPQAGISSVKLQVKCFEYCDLRAVTYSYIQRYILYTYKTYKVQESNPLALSVAMPICHEIRFPVIC